MKDIEAWESLTKDEGCCNNLETIQQTIGRRKLNEQNKNLFAWYGTFLDGSVARS